MKHFNFFKSLLLVLLAVTTISCEQEEPTVKASEIKVEAAQNSIFVGSTTTITVTVLPADATDKQYTLSINEEGKSIISLSGYTVTGLAEGTATITASIGDIKGTCDITVTEKGEVIASEIRIQAENSTIAVGESTNLTVTILPEDATNTDYSLSVNDDAIVSIDGNVVTGLAEGTATITASIGDIKGTCDITVTKAASLEVEKVLIEAAGVTFVMGSPETEVDRFPDETPHNVTFTKDYYISKYEITNAQYAEFLNANEIKPTHSFTSPEGLEYVYVTESESIGVYFNYSGAKWVAATGKDNYPVVYVTWFGAQAYAEWAGGSLPSEAQWEFACRAGTQTAYSFGDDPSMFAAYGVCEINAEGEHASQVGSKQPNAWGIYDMHGNANEWCLDSWDMFSAYGPEDVVDPVSPNPGGFNVIRGGSWYSSVSYCRSAVRIVGQPDYATDDSGFRVVFPAE